MLSNLLTGDNNISCSSLFHILLLVLLLPFTNRAQEISVLEEEEAFYNNFALTSYSKEYVEEELEEFYDLFGEHITDGFFIYSLTNDRQFVSTAYTSDSTTKASSNEHRAELFYENFRNICYTRDAIGGVKTAFILGDQIRTRFSPLVFNKRNYEGIRWDIWYENLGITSLMSRTRPGLMSREYDWTIDEARITESWVTFPMLGVALDRRGDEWNKSVNVDWTARTAFGDYDFLWAFYVNKKFRDNFRVGVSYLNHHHSDVKKGEKWNGDLPNGLAPDEIHLEFYDLTWSNEADPGVKINNVSITVNTEDGSYGPYQPAAWYRGDEDYLFAEPAALPLTQNGHEPLICTFYPKDMVTRDSSKIMNIKFDLDISGNYIVFISTDRTGPLHDNHWSDERMEYDMKQIRDIYVVGDSVYDTTVSRLDPESEAYFGDYILRSPKLAANINDNHYAPFTYYYRMPTARIVYGIDFEGKLFNADIKGEVAINNKKEKYPTPKGKINNTFNLAGYVTTEYPVNKQLKVKGGVFNMAPDYQPYLSTYQASRWLAVRAYDENNGAPMYGTYPVVLGNNYTTIDDNEDDDYYVENNRSVYPSEQASNTAGNFYNDGSRSRYVQTVYLPSADRSFWVVYDDWDGVIPDRYDRNKNGRVDYREDFLLYQADPPLFDLEPDDNNNGITDAEEDDIYPDYPYKSSYIYTSNGFKSLGIRGLTLAGEYGPFKNLSIEAGLDMRRALDPNIDGRAEALETSEGKAMMGYGRAIYRLTNRALGLNVFLGQELKYVKDALRDDVVQGSYSITTDWLQFRNALVSNTAASVNYLNIPNFEVTGKLALRGEQHIEDPEEIYVTRKIGGSYESGNFDYPATTILGLDGIAKMAYDIKLHRLPPYLGFLKKLTITPQYKLSYSFRVSDDEDPRDNPKYDDVIILSSKDTLRQEAVKLWTLFDAYNKNEILSVPILRMSYPLGDKTYIDFGWQWKRNYNMLVHARNYGQETRVLQIVSKDSYNSFNVAVQIGWQWNRTRYDLDFYHPVYGYGTNWRNQRNQGFFCKIFAGI